MGIRSCRIGVKILIIILLILEGSSIATLTGKGLFEKTLDYMSKSEYFIKTAVLKSETAMNEI